MGCLMKEVIGYICSREYIHRAVYATTLISINPEQSYQSTLHYKEEVHFWN